METKDKSPIQEFLEQRESVGEHLINVRAWATDKADGKFCIEYEKELGWNELYYLPCPEERPDEWKLKDKYNDIYWRMVDEYENKLLEYQSELYE